MTPLEAAARELVKYKTIPEFYEQEWPNCVNSARDTISAYFKACKGRPEFAQFHGTADLVFDAAIALLAALKPEA